MPHETDNCSVETISLSFRAHFIAIASVCACVGWNSESGLLNPQKVINGMRSEKSFRFRFRWWNVITQLAFYDFSLWRFRWIPTECHWIDIVVGSKSPARGSRIKQASVWQLAALFRWGYCASQLSLPARVYLFGSLTRSVFNGDKITTNQSSTNSALRTYERFSVDSLRQKQKQK